MTLLEAMSIESVQGHAHEDRHHDGSEGDPKVSTVGFEEMEACRLLHDQRGLLRSVGLRLSFSHVIPKADDVRDQGYHVRGDGEDYLGGWIGTRSWVRLG